MNNNNYKFLFTVFIICSFLSCNSKESQVDNDVNQEYCFCIKMLNEYLNENEVEVNDLITCTDSFEALTKVKSERSGSTLNTPSPSRRTFNLWVKILEEQGIVCTDNR